MKNGINTDQFRVKTGSRGNGRKNPSPISVNTETEPCKYGNEWTKVENRTGRNGNFFPAKEPLPPILLWVFYYFFLANNNTPLEGGRYVSTSLPVLFSFHFSFFFSFSQPDIFHFFIFLFFSFLFFSFFFFSCFFLFFSY
jgi:hypothetical protein